MMHSKHEVEGVGWIEIHYDDDAGNPRKEFDETGTLTALKKGVDIGQDESMEYWEFVEARAQEIHPEFPDLLDTWGCPRSEAWANHAKAIMEKHFHCVGLDISGRHIAFGIFYETDEAVLWCRKGGEIDKSHLKCSAALLRAYYKGDVFCYVVKLEDPLTEEIEDGDSCWGFYGESEIPYMIEQAKTSLPKADEQRVFDLSEAV